MFRSVTGVPPHHWCPFYKWNWWNLKVEPANEYLSHLGKSPNKVLEWIIRHKNSLRCNESKWFNFSFKGFEVASSVHYVQKREKKKEPKMNKRVHVLQKLDILFGLNTRSHSTYYTHPRQLRSTTLITNLFFQKWCNFQKQVKGKKRIFLEGKKETIFWNIYNLKIFWHGGIFKINKNNYSIL
jgi:hypothetical protein